MPGVSARVWCGIRKGAWGSYTIGTTILEDLRNSSADLVLGNSAVPCRAVTDTGDGCIDHLVVAVVGLDVPSLGWDQFLDDKVSSNSCVRDRISIMQEL